MDRRNNFDALRLGAAILVVFSHAFLIGEGREDGEPLMRLSGGQTVLGVLAVFVFFTISGFLVSASFEATGSPWRFLAKRALRVYPGLGLCLAVAAFLIGPFFTTLPLLDYFADAGTHGFVAANLLMDADWNSLPGVRFTGWDFGTVVDGPLWSLPCEVLMYLMVAVLGAFRLLRWPVLAALFAAGLVCILFDTASIDGVFSSAGWLLSFFVAGMALYRLRATRIFDGRIALLALTGLVLSVPLGRLILLFPIFGSYLVVYLALTKHLPPLPVTRFGDLSYGLYIYGWPVEQIVVHLLGGAAPWWQVFILSLPLAALCAAISWRVVEQPALRLKPGSAPVPVKLPLPAG